MARESESIAEIINSAVDRVASRLIARMHEAMSVPMPATRSEPQRRNGGKRTQRRKGEDLTRWVADARARRVPKFVIETTGLDTKKKIVARFGAGATFEKGKPLPPVNAPSKGAKTAPHGSAARVVTAKSPTIRKASAP